MIEYFIDVSTIPIELTILSGGTTVTGRSPYVEIRNKSNNQYFDFATNSFNAAPTSSTAPMVSAIDGLYRFTWDVSGLFNSAANLLFEYHDATALSVDDVLFRPPVLSTGDVTLSSMGGAPGNVIIHGQFSKEDKDKLFEKLDEINSDLEFFRQTALGALEQLLSRRVIKIEDLKFLTTIKERDLAMYQELLKILDLKSTANEKEIFEKLTQYIKREEDAKKGLMEKLNELLTAKQEIPKVIEKTVKEEDEDE